MNNFNGFFVALIFPKFNFSFGFKGARRVTMKWKPLEPFRMLGRFSRSLLNKNEVYAIDKVFMKMLGMWPEADNYRYLKIFVVVVVLLLVNVFPSINYFRMAVLSKNAKKIGLVVPEIITNISILYGAMSFCFNRTLLKKFIDEVDKEWKKKDFSETRRKTSKAANVFSMANHIGLHAAGIMYCSIPNFVFLAKRFAFGNFEETFFGYQLSEWVSVD